MSYDLINLSMNICRKFSKHTWVKALELARLYGWTPMGTCSPIIYNLHALNADWDGNYLTNDGQMVSAEDARSLAEALEKSLDDIPDTNPQIDWAPGLWTEDDLPAWLSPTERAMIEGSLQDGLLDTMGVHPYEFFAGAEKYHLIEFIRFCRLGSFEIQ